MWSVMLPPLFRCLVLLTLFNGHAGSLWCLEPFELSFIIRYKLVDVKRFFVVLKDFLYIYRVSDTITIHYQLSTIN